MFHLNNKGFTLIEITAAVLILVVLTLITTSAFLTYSDWAKKKAFDTMARSASVAAEQYIMDFPHANVPESEARKPENYDKGISFDTLADEGYLNDVKDPADNSHRCSGKVVVGYMEADEDDSRALDQYMYVVYECCSNFKARYIFTVKKQTVKDKDGTREEVKPVSEVSLKDAICK